MGALYIKNNQMSVIEEEIDKEIIKCIDETAKGLTRSCARNAIHHLERAWKLKDIDPEMAIFRSITAEEEAATAIFIALKEKGYDNAKKLKFKNHAYKQALEPFIRSICTFSEKFSKVSGFPFGEKFQLKIEGEGKEKKLSLSFYYMQGTVTAIPPLEFEIKLDDKPYHFDNELLEITSGKSRNDVVKHIEKIANLRNEILYAQPAGIPKIESNIEGYIRKKKNIVFILLRVFALTYPYKEKALFVQQALNAYLAMMGEIENVA